MLSKVAADNKAAIERAREGRVKPHDIQGSTFTVSDLGACDVDHFIAIINPPKRRFWLSYRRSKFPLLSTTKPQRSLKHPWYNYLMKLPTVKGKNLQRQKMVFPKDFAGEVNLVFIAFLRRHQDVIDEWVPFVEKLANENPDIQYYEFPTLPRRGPIYRTFLNEGMRAGIPNPATRARTVTLYLDKSNFQKALDIQNDQDMWIYLFNKSGDVVWRIAGRFTAKKGQALRDALQLPFNS